MDNNPKYHKRPVFKPCPTLVEAIITSYLPYGEAHCIVKLWTSEYGRLTAFVRNGLKPSKKTSPIQAPAMASLEIEFHQKESLYKIHHWDMSSHTFQWVQDLRIWGLCCYLCEIIEIFLPEEEPFPEIYTQSKQMLHWLGQKQAPTSLLRAFELKLLHASGYLPDLNLLIQSTHKTPAFSKEACEACYVLAFAPLCLEAKAPKEALRLASQLFQWKLKELAKSPLKSLRYLREIGERPS